MTDERKRPAEERPRRVRREVRGEKDRARWSAPSDRTWEAADAT